MTSTELDGRVSLVTGASRGIGRAIALKLSSMGSRIAINHIASEKDNAANLVKDIVSQGGEAIPVEADIGDSEAVKGMVQAVTDQWNTIDIPAH